MDDDEGLRRLPIDFEEVASAMEDHGGYGAHYLDLESGELITLPEELPVNEAHDLVAEVLRTGVAPLGVAFVNQVIATLFDDETRSSLATVRARASDDPALQHLLEVAERRVERERLERTQRARARDLGMPVIELPYLLQPRLARADVERLAGVVLEAP